MLLCRAENNNMPRGVEYYNLLPDWAEYYSMLPAGAGYNSMLLCGAEYYNMSARPGTTACCRAGQSTTTC